MIHLKSFFSNVSDMPFVRNTFLGLISLAPVMGSAQSDDDQEKKALINWSSSSVDLLYSAEDYIFEGNKHFTLTAWHVNDWRFGDTFAFVDFDNDGGRYGEILPRLSFNKMFGIDTKLGPIKDILLASTFEFPKGLPTRILVGVGTDLDIKGFDFLKQNFYVRDDPTLDGVTWQSTTEFGVHLLKKLELNGFIDIAGAEGGSSFNIVSQPRLLLDLSAIFKNLAEGRAKFGLEGFFWNNKFAVPGANEAIFQTGFVIQVH